MTQAMADLAVVESAFVINSHCYTTSQSNIQSSSQVADSTCCGSFPLKSGVIYIALTVFLFTLVSIVFAIVAQKNTVIEDQTYIVSWIAVGFLAVADVVLFLTAVTFVCGVTWKNTQSYINFVIASAVHAIVSVPYVIIQLSHGFSYFRECRSYCYGGPWLVVSVVWSIVLGVLDVYFATVVSKARRAVDQL